MCRFQSVKALLGLSIVQSVLVEPESFASFLVCELFAEATAVDCANRLPYDECGGFGSNSHAAGPTF
jgi:hypothetical protein